MHSFPIGLSLCFQHSIVMLEGIECHVHTKQLLLIRTQPSLHMGWLTVALPAIPLPSGRQGREWGWVSVVCIGLPAVDSE